jgi:Protein of unknown function (DUF4019)
MLTRRFFLFAVGAAAVTHGGASLAQTAAARGIEQADFLFWMDDRARAAARQAADGMAAALDSRPEQLLESAKRLHAAVGRPVQARFKADEFAARVAQGRNGLGPLRGRALQGVEGGFRMLPNLPDGEYCIAIFDLQFENQKQLVTEQFTLSRSAAGEWQLVNYYLGEKPFYRY